MRSGNTIRVCDRCLADDEDEFLVGSLAIDHACSRCGGDRAFHLLLPGGNDPRLIGYGAVTFSTCTDLAVPWRMIWDTNHYYADLQVDPHATRVELKQAYQRLCGWESPRLTYVLKQLLDPQVRLQYDATPLGSFFMDYEIETIMRQSVIDDVLDDLADGDVSYEDVYDQGLIDKIPWGADNGSGPHGKEDGSQVGWRYYVWATPCRSEVGLDLWRQALCLSLGRRKLHLQLAVGWIGDPGFSEQFRVETVGDHTVVFLSDGPAQLLSSNWIRKAEKLMFLNQVVEAATDTILMTLIHHS